MNFIVILFLTSFSLFARTPLVVEVHYEERPPFLTASPTGEPTGLTGSVVSAALKKTGYEYRWMQTPTKRQMLIIQDKQGATKKEFHCGIGWYKNRERSKFAKYSEPIYRDKQPTLIVAKNSKVVTGQSLKTILKDNRVLVRDGHSYGVVLDKILLEMKAQVETTTTQTPVMIDSVAKGRVEATLVSGEEADAFLTAKGLAEEVKRVSFSEATGGEPRYLMCSNDVPDDFLISFNKALKP